ncbi:MAG: glycosyltransferase [Ruminococcus flavefaciens]|nr:glycosyltransferase [Ruminococcus flavefaciens]
MNTISIVMPLYNAEKYLKECLESVLGQTFTEYELICVDDASTDSTYKILEEFQKRDERIHIISNAERCGAAASRNKGMFEARGKYLAFLDGDDIFDETMLEKAYGAAEEKGADVVVFEYKHVPSEYIHNKLKIFHSKEYIDRYCGKAFSVQDCEPYEIINWGLGPWNKLYKRSFIEENQLVFQDLPCANDIYFVSMTLMLADKIVLVENESVLVYVRDHFEASRISTNRDSMCNYRALVKIGQELKKRDKLEKLYGCFYYRVFFSLKDGLMADGDKVRAKAFYSFLQKDGIDKLCSIGEKYYNLLDEYLYHGLQNFKEKSFESDWYKEENILKICLYINEDKVVNLFNDFSYNNKKVAIWGAGNNGKVLADFCRYHKLKIEMVIDKSKEKQGNLLAGYAIVSPDVALKEIQVIVISAYSIYRSIIEEAKGKKVDVIDINSFFYLY